MKINHEVLKYAMARWVDAYRAGECLEQAEADSRSVDDEAESSAIALESWIDAALAAGIGQTPGDSGNPLTDIADWIKASGSNRTNVQLGCHFEEVSEELDELIGANDAADEAIAAAYDSVVALATMLKSGEISVDIRNRDDFLDAICDQIVTATASATMFKMDAVDGIARVNASNWSKYVDGKPIFDANGKIAKGPNYVKADLKGLT